MNDTQQTIGKILTDETERDAIHIAVFPAIAHENVYTGEMVELLVGSTDRVVRSRVQKNSIGIVDPFLKDGAEAGQKFWVFLHPNTVTGMRHAWQHPAFKPPTRTASEKQKAKKWLEQFAQRWGFDWDTLIGVADAVDVDVKIQIRDILLNRSEEPYYVTAGVDLCGSEDLGEDHETFWKNLGIYTGKTFTEAQKKRVGWACSC